MSVTYIIQVKYSYGWADEEQSRPFHTYKGGLAELRLFRKEQREDGYRDPEVFRLIQRVEKVYSI